LGVTKWAADFCLQHQNGITFWRLAWRCSGPIAPGQWRLASGHTFPIQWAPGVFEQLAMIPLGQTQRLLLGGKCVAKIWLPKQGSESVHIRRFTPLCAGPLFVFVFVFARVCLCVQHTLYAADSMRAA